MEVNRIQSELLDKVSSDAFPMTASQLAAMAEELQVDDSVSGFFERIPERSFSSREEVIEYAEQESGSDSSGGDSSSSDSLGYEDLS